MACKDPHSKARCMERKSAAQKRKDLRLIVRKENIVIEAHTKRSSREITRKKNDVKHELIEHKNEKPNLMKSPTVQCDCEVPIQVKLIN